MSSKNQSKESQLLKIAEEIRACGLCREGKTGLPVPGEGNPDAEIFFVGEAPGKLEAKQGRPFIGRSGNFLRGVLRELGLKEEEVFITSPVKYLPLRGTPSKVEITHGCIHLARQLAVVDPKIVVLMGNVAVWALLGLEGAVSQEHGKVIRKDGRSYLITFHPAAAMRFPKIRAEFYKDFEMLKKFVRK
ncbi:MAG TPA: uracil-DNA glycosylase [Thermodesulfobacteriota bacterium]|nr:uracil-DNA glycosylase [Thermodesulfobacteriota bacterium]